MAQKKPSQVHRTLTLASPPSKAADVRALQQAIDKELRHRKLEWRVVKQDGEFGKRTLHAAHFLGWVLGLSHGRLQAMLGENGHTPHLSERIQELLRDSSKRSVLDRGRERARREEVRQLRKTHNTGPVAAVTFLKQAARKGVHEEGSTNTGPLVDKWESYFGIHAEPWCGCLAGYAAKAIGGSQASTWFPYGPSIMADAAAHRNGVYEVPFDEIEPGDVLVYWGGEHVGTAVKKSVGDSISAVEGNTSPTDGDSQADGGAVAEKTRSREDVSCVARVYG